MAVLVKSNTAYLCSAYLVWSWTAQQTYCSGVAVWMYCMFAYSCRSDSSCSSTTASSTPPTSQPEAGELRSVVEITVSCCDGLSIYRAQSLGWNVGSYHFCKPPTSSFFWSYIWRWKGRWWSDSRLWLRYMIWKRDTRGYFEGHQHTCRTKEDLLSRLQNNTYL